MARLVLFRPSEEKKGNFKPLKCRMQSSDPKFEEVMEEENEARIAGVNGVPFFVINGQPAFSGAQSPEHFFQAIMNATQTGEKCGSDSCST